MSLIRKIWTILELLGLVIADRFNNRIGSINLRLRGLSSIPAIPFKLRLIKTLRSLGSRNSQTKQAVQGLSTLQTIDGVTRPAHAFLWSDETVDTDEAEHSGDRSAAARFDLEKKLNNPLAMARHLAETLADDDDDSEEVHDTTALTSFSLEKPEQFSMAWTTFPDIYGQSEHLLAGLSATLTDVEAADRAFWNTISEYGMPYNLLFLEKVNDQQAAQMAELFGSAWNAKLVELQGKGLVYVIDLRIFETTQAQQTSGGLRMSPGSVTILCQDAESKTLLPVLIRVSGYQGQNAQIYMRDQATESAWLYALQAAKASIGTYGIWLGHVYHWHIPTAAVQMTMYNNLPEDHPLYLLLHPQSQYLIEFDTLLLLLWKQIAPPTSITSARKFLALEDTYAEGRTFFDDDPTTTLEKHGITEEDFTVDEPWDQFQFAGRLLNLWQITGDYVKEVVDALYADDQAVKNDQALQNWMKATANKREGNIRGLPSMDGRHSLRRFLHSYLYRITAHGSSRLPNAANPGLTFVSNFPPCLQRDDIPMPEAELTTKDLLTYLPNTGTIGEYLSFFYIFSFSVPSASVVPPNGIHEELFFDGNTPGEKACNAAQVKFRERIIKFIGEYQDGTPQVTQWARNIET